MAALDPDGPTSDPNIMASGATKTVGKLKKTPWQRFERMQLTAARLAKGRGQPKGVFRFATYEACAQWTANLNRNGN